MYMWQNFVHKIETHLSPCAKLALEKVCVPDGQLFAFLDQPFGPAHQSIILLKGYVLTQNTNFVLSYYTNRGFYFTKSVARHKFRVVRDKVCASCKQTFEQIKQIDKLASLPWPCSW
jgi:hypothetical protein